MQAKYPASAYRGVRADIPDWLIGVPSLATWSAPSSCWGCGPATVRTTSRAGPVTSSPGWCTPWDPAAW